MCRRSRGSVGLICECYSAERGQKHILYYGSSNSRLPPVLDQVCPDYYYNKNRCWLCSGKGSSSLWISIAICQSEVFQLLSLIWASVLTNEKAEVPYINPLISAMIAAPPRCLIVFVATLTPGWAMEAFLTKQKIFSYQIQTYPNGLHRDSKYGFPYKKIH